MTTAPRAVLQCDLKPCPFCGDTLFLAVTHSRLTEQYQFWQVECGCHASGAPEMTRDAAISTWNTRQSSPTIDEKQSETLHRTLIESFNEFERPIPVDVAGGGREEGGEARPIDADLPTALMQARWVLKDYHAKQPGCGFDKLAVAVTQACEIIEAALATKEG